jgi:GntR family transcriptional regulator
MSPRPTSASGFGSFSDDMRSRGHVPGAKVLAFIQVEPEAEIRERLQLAQGEQTYMLKRLRLADDRPVAVETAHLPCRLCPGLIDEDLNNHSLYSILTEKYHLVPTWADAELDAQIATEEESDLLDLEIGKPVLSARRVTFSANYDVIEVVKSVYRGDRFTFYSGRQFIG